MNKQAKHKYWFWRWIILSIVRFDKLYFLVWGILILGMVICFKNDISGLIGVIFR